MILIISEKNDLSTNQVIDWLIFLNKKWIRINVEDVVDISFNGSDIEIKNDFNKFNLSEITSFWYRRGFFNFKKNFQTNIREVDYVLNEEIENIMNFIYYKLTTLKHISSILNENINKLIVCDIAKKFKIDTPDDLIFSNKESLNQKLHQSKEDYITKITSGRTITEFNNFNIYNYTSKVDLKKVSENFFPSLVQNYIPKRYELRIFYLDSKFYTMAIFSQKKEKTNIDFRNFDDEKMSRCVPYNLPTLIENKLDMLMKELKLNSGSIDMIVTPNFEYVFLEVNPVGQFGMTSYPCNFNLEKKIAKYL